MKHIPHVLFVFLLAGPVVGCSAPQDRTDRIRLNQVGFDPDAPKEAVVVGEAGSSFAIVDEATGDTVRRGDLTSSDTWSLSGDTVRRASFDDLRVPGTYRVVVPGVGSSYAFDVEAGLLETVAEAALNGYYYQRASTALPETYAAQWARPSGHPDDSVRVHPSAATDTRPAGTQIAAPKGWYDAGDYNKYVVNSGISTYTLLSLYEHAPEVAANVQTDIPERGNSVPDVLDEALWNVRWMLNMQAPDGGVYHKLTHAGFSGVVMPHEATAPRYVVQKGTAATLNFAAVMAQGARLYSAFENAFPGLADSMRVAALDAWSWARRHPDVPYDQSELNKTHDPDITTGAYGDTEFTDEFAWAASELAVTTGADSFLVATSPLEHELSVPSWSNVDALAWYTLLHHGDHVASAVDTSALKQRFVAFADGLLDGRASVPYGTVMGQEADDFVWGSNSVAGNQAVLLLQAYRVTGEAPYLHAAHSNLDYLLGRNATGYSFLTGFGTKTPMHVHHRPSEADTVKEPVPGLLAGGPNPGQQDRENCLEAGASYPSDRPARAYVDHFCSYASNEIAINWNAPLVYAAALVAASDQE